MNPSTRLDVNCYSVAGEVDRDLTGLDLREIDGSQFSSLLKITHCRRVTGIQVLVPQGTENAMDLDDVESAVIDGHFGFGPVKGDQVITIKGGCRNFRVTGILHSRGTRSADIEIGNWFDQNQRLTSSGILDFRHADGGKIRVAIGWVVPFSVKLRGACTYALLPSLKIKAYFLTKYVVRSVLRIKQGQKGPSWL